MSNSENNSVVESPFGDRKSFSNFERRLSRTSTRTSRQESSDSGSQDFREIARRISRSGASTQLLDSAARVAALKKIEAEEKLKMQQQIEEMKNKMNNVVTVEKTGFDYDPSKVRGQMEDEMKQAQDVVDGAPEDPKSDEYNKWLEEIMSQGWNEEVKELVSGKKKVSKRNLIRARKRSIVRRYSIIVPEVKNEFNLPVEEDEFTEEEKLRQHVEQQFEEIDLNYTIEELSNNQQWMAEIQELVVSKKKVNYHNLRNARKRNIVKSSLSMFEGIKYDLTLEPDELTDSEIMRLKLNDNIASIRIIVESDCEFEAMVDSLSKTWIFDVDSLETDKKKKNKKNLFNLLVRQLITQSKEKVPGLEYDIELEEDDLTDEEQRNLEFHIQVDNIILRTDDLSLEELIVANKDMVNLLNCDGKKVTRDNLINILKREACLSVFGEDDAISILELHNLTDDKFEMTDKSLAETFINQRLEVVEEKLKNKGKLHENFADEIARLKSIKAETHETNINKMCLSMAKEEANKLYPDAGILAEPAHLELTDEGKHSIILSSEINKLDSFLTNNLEDGFIHNDKWVAQRAYLETNNMKVSAKNIINAKKKSLYDEYKNKFPGCDCIEELEFESFTIEEQTEIQRLKTESRYKDVCSRLNNAIRDAKIALDRAHKRSLNEGNALEENLDKTEWNDEIAHLTSMKKSQGLKNLFEIKSQNILERYKRENKEFNFDDYSVINNSYESDPEVEEDEVTGDDESVSGCFTCEMRSKTSFFSDLSDDVSVPAKIDESGEIDEDEFDDVYIGNPVSEEYEHQPVTVKSIENNLEDILGQQTNAEQNLDRCSEFDFDNAIENKTPEDNITCEMRSKTSFFSDLSDDVSVPAKIDESGKIDEDEFDDVYIGNPVTYEYDHQPVTVKSIENNLEDTLGEQITAEQHLDRCSEFDYELEDKTPKDNINRQIFHESCSGKGDETTYDDIQEIITEIHTHADNYEDEEKLQDGNTDFKTSDNALDIRDNIIAPKTQDQDNNNSARPEILLSEGFIPSFDDHELEYCLQTAPLSSSINLQTPLDPMSSPFPNHGYISPQKTFDSMDAQELFYDTINNAGDSAYESKSSYNGEDLEPIGLGISFPQQESETVDRNTVGEHIDVENPNHMLPCNLKCDSMGSDNVFDIQSSNTTPSPLLNEIVDIIDEDKNEISPESEKIVDPIQNYTGSVPNDVTMTRDNVTNSEDEAIDKDTPISPIISDPDVTAEAIDEITYDISGNEGDSEYSPGDDGSESRRTSTDPIRPHSLPGKTIEQMRKLSSDTSEDIEQDELVNPIRSPKRKKFSVSTKPHPVIERQQEYLQRNAQLQSKRISIASKASMSTDDVRIGPESPKSPRPSNLPIFNNRQGMLKRNNTDSNIDKFSHLSSNYKMDRNNQYFDRSKYIKVPTLEDKTITTEPIIEGLIPKDFYKQTLSYDYNDSAKSTTRTRSNTAPAAAPTTGHIYWHLLKERKLEREEAYVITDLDMAVRAIVSRCTCKTPFQLDRVGDGKYKLPNTSQIFFVRILRNHVMVRVGGGWDTLDHFIAKHDPCRMKFKQISGGGAFTPSPTSSPRSPVTKKNNVPQSPLSSGKKIQKSASNHNVKNSPSRESPASTPKTSRPRPSDGMSKLPRPSPRGVSKLPQPRTFTKKA